MSFNSLGSGPALTWETRPLACRNAPPWPTRPSLPRPLPFSPRHPAGHAASCLGAFAFSVPSAWHTLPAHHPPAPPRPGPSRSLPRPLLQRGCLREERGSICEPDRHTLGWAPVLGKMCECNPGAPRAARYKCTGVCACERVRPPGSVEAGRAERASRELPAHAMSVSELLSPSSKPTLLCEAPARGCELPFPECLVAAEFLSGFSNWRPGGS